MAKIQMNLVRGYFRKGHESFRKARRWIASTTFFSLVLLLLFAASIFIVDWVDLTNITNISLLKTTTKVKKQQTQYPLDCFNGSSTATCPTYYPSKFESGNYPSATCPEYFRWIHEDLKPWESTGITRDMMERGQNISSFRLVIINGKAYVKTYVKSYQTRDVLTIWGILQLLRLYPGKIPDLELMFQCDDWPVVNKKRFQGPQAMSPPPVFHYCGEENAYDIVFPDWSFWGWPEINIRPWEETLQKIQVNNKMIKWKDRIPYAYWKGNPTMGNNRKELCKCNVSEQHDWNARIYNNDWRKEISQNFKNSKLEDQCTHRYKIYVEGYTWSVSEKYITLCDSMTMFVEPRYFEFFTRNMVPLQHYWPISAKNMCEEIKFAVDWGNTHLDKAEGIGKRGTDYLIENLEMKFVYDYMFHLLNGYARLLRFKPTIPAGAVEICSETLACPARDPVRQSMVDTIVKSPSDAPPCTMPPPYKPEALQQFLQTNENLIKLVKTRAISNN